MLRPISLTQGDKRIALYPSDHFKVTYSISFDHPLIRHQSRTMRITEDTFVEEIAPARTFGFLKEVEMLRQRGLALGGSLDNAIVLGETGVLNNALRFEDEFVRHKILDVIGDLSLVGYPVIGHLVAHRGGHALHTAFAARILEEADAWRLVEGGDRHGCPGRDLRAGDGQGHGATSQTRTPLLHTPAAVGATARRRRRGVSPSRPHRTTSSLVVVGDPSLSNQSMPSLTRSNFRRSVRASSGALTVIGMSHGRSGLQVRRQPGALVVAVDQRPVRRAQLRAETHEAAAVARLRRERPRREIRHARADGRAARPRRAFSGARACGEPRRPISISRARRRARDRVAQVVASQISCSMRASPACRARSGARTCSRDDR